MRKFPVRLREERGSNFNNMPPMSAVVAAAGTVINNYDVGMILIFLTLTLTVIVHP